MTFRNHPTDIMGNPDGRDYHYRFHANDEEAQKRLRHARWKDRYIEMYPSDMEHLRVEIGHVTFKTYDKMGYIKGMKKYAKSPNWQRVPYSRGKKEMTNASHGGTKVRAKEYTGEAWGNVTVEYHIDATPTEIKDAFENGVNDAEISRKMQEAQHWAVEEKIDELREAKWQAQQDCEHSHVVVKGSDIPPIAYCEDCNREWHDINEFEQMRDSDELNVVSAIA